MPFPITLERDTQTKHLGSLIKSQRDELLQCPASVNLHIRDPTPPKSSPSFIF